MHWRQPHGALQHIFLGSCSLFLCVWTLRKMASGASTAINYQLPSVALGAIGRAVFLGLAWPVRLGATANPITIFLNFIHFFCVFKPSGVGPGREPISLTIVFFLIFMRQISQQPGSCGGGAYQTATNKNECTCCLGCPTTALPAQQLLARSDLPNPSTAKREKNESVPMRVAEA